MARSNPRGGRIGETPKHLKEYKVVQNSFSQANFSLDAPRVRKAMPAYTEKKAVIKKMEMKVRIPQPIEVISPVIVNPEDRYNSTDEGNDMIEDEV